MPNLGGVSDFWSESKKARCGARERPVTGWYAADFLGGLPKGCGACQKRRP